MKQETIFLSVAANHFSEMRLMAEGAIALYENQATVLCSMARDADNHEAQIAFNDIGAALYDLRSHMEELQEALHQAVLLWLIYWRISLEANSTASSNGMGLVTS